MATILREPGQVYLAHYDKVPLDVVANSERTFPDAWIASSRTSSSNEFVRYARPLIGKDWPSVPLVNGLQRFTRLKPMFAQKTLPIYEPQAYRPPSGLPEPPRFRCGVALSLSAKLVYTVPGLWELSA